MLSLPAIRPDGSRVFESLEQHYHRASTTRVEHVVHANDPRQMQLDVDDDAAPHFVANDMQDGLDDAPMSTRILFRLVKKNPSRQKVMPSEFAVGRKFAAPSLCGEFDWSGHMRMTTTELVFLLAPSILAKQQCFPC